MWRWSIAVACLIVLVVFGACGVTDEGTAPVATEEPAAAEGQAASPEPATEAPSVGETQDVGPIAVTLLEVRDFGPRVPPEGDVWVESDNDHFVAAMMRIENLTDEVVTEFPTAQCETDAGTIFEASMLADPEPSFQEQMFDFKLPPGGAVEGWIPFDISGQAVKLHVYMSGEDPTEPEYAAWGL